MSVEATALSAPLEKATNTPWPCVPVLFLDDIFLVFCCCSWGEGRLAGVLVRREAGHLVEGTKFKPRQSSLRLYSAGERRGDYDTGGTGEVERELERAEKVGVSSTEHPNFSVCLL